MLVSETGRAPAPVLPVEVCKLDEAAGFETLLRPLSETANPLVESYPFAVLP